jgi:hypothetical protein
MMAFQNSILQGDSNNNVQGKKQHRTEAQEWYFRLINDPKQFEKDRFIDNINVFNDIIEEFQKLYENTPAADRSARLNMTCLRNTMQEQQ